MRRLLRFAAALLVLLLPGPLPAGWGPAASGRGGAVAADESAAVEVGLGLLAVGGNAVDAAVGTALALAVVHPEAGNLGGGGFALVRVGGEVAALDFRETAPGAARPEGFVDARGEPIPEASTVGPLAAGVPGSPAGLAELHRRFGRLPWSAVVAPAERLARGGFPLSARSARSLAAAADLLRRFPESAAAWLPQGEPIPAGAIVRLPALAETLADYGRRGAVAVTAGARAAAIARAAGRHGGVLAVSDLAAYQPVWRQAVRSTAFGWEIAGMPLPSSGGTIVAQSAALLERLGWHLRPRFGGERGHLLAEVWRRAFADRVLLGDPATARATPERLLAPARLDGLAAKFDPERATPSAAVAAGEYLSPAEPRETTHLSVVDGDGQAVALTTTINDLFGCGLFVPEVGIFLNNEMDDFTVAPGRPNLFGLVQGEANTVAPGRRMLSSMSPTLAWRGAEIVALGGRGGSRIPTGTLQVLLHLLVDGDDLATAVGRARLHHQWLPDALEAEADALAPEARASLEARATPEVNAVRRLATGRTEAAGDPRGPGAGGVEHPLP